MNDYQHLLDDAEGIEVRHATPDAASQRLARFEYSGIHVPSGQIPAAERAAAYLRLYDIAYEIRVGAAGETIVIDSTDAARVLDLLIRYGCPPQRLVMPLALPNVMKGLRQLAERSRVYAIDVIEEGIRTSSDHVSLVDKGPTAQVQATELAGSTRTIPCEAVRTPSLMSACPNDARVVTDDVGGLCLLHWRAIRSGVRLSRALAASGPDGTWYLIEGPGEWTSVPTGPSVADGVVAPWYGRDAAIGLSGSSTELPCWSSGCPKSAETLDSSGSFLCLAHWWDEEQTTYHDGGRIGTLAVRGRDGVWRLVTRGWHFGDLLPVADAGWGVDYFATTDRRFRYPRPEERTALVLSALCSLEAELLQRWGVGNQPALEAVRALRSGSFQHSQREARRANDRLNP